MNTTTFIIGFIAAISSVAVAEPTNWYVGGSLTHNGKTDTEFSDSSFGWGIKLGYQISPASGDRGINRFIWSARYAQSQ